MGGKGMSAIAFSKPSSGGSFGDLGGSPGDNAALAAALALKFDSSSVPILNGVNVMQYGATGTARKVTDGVINGTTTFTSATAAFTAADVGKSIWGVEVATGLARLPVRTITSVTNSTTVVFSGTSSGIGSYSGLQVVIGTDDSTAILNAFTAAFATTPAKSLHLPAGGYVISERLFNMAGGSGIKGCMIFGDGSRSTFLYPSPSFNVAGVSAGQGLIAHLDGATKHGGLSGMTIDGSYYNFAATGNYVLCDLGAANLYQDVKLQFFKGVNTGLLCSGSFTLLKGCSFEGFNYNALSIVEGHTHAQDCYCGNAGNYSLYIASIAGESNGGARVTWVGGTVDESTSGGLDVNTASTDIVFLGAILFGPPGQYAARIGNACKVRFIGCQIVPFGTGNRGGLKVLSGGTAWLVGCRVAGSGTLYAMDNAGTVYDGGGNVIGSITGSNSLTWMDYDRLPTSDPVNKGVLWRSGTALQISAG
jgi:hypothetical protein